MTNLAENLATTTSQGDLARELQRLRDAEGVTFAAIANKTGISRSAISQLVNQGLRMKPEHEKKLWDAVNEIKGTEERLGPDVPVAPIHFKTRIELFETKEFKECMGWCNYVCSKRKMGVMVGHPGSGKTTVLRHFAQTQPGVLYIEAWPQMRVGDMLEAIARPLGLSLRGNNYRKTQDLIAYLSGRTDVLIAVDEAEYLAKWDVDKFEVLRKVWDNTGTPVILCGTDVLEGMLTRGRGRGSAYPPARPCRTGSPACRCCPTLCAGPRTCPRPTLPDTRPRPPRSARPCGPTGRRSGPGSCGSCCRAGTGPAAARWPPAYRPRASAARLRCKAHQAGSARSGAARWSCRCQGGPP